MANIMRVSGEGDGIVDDPKRNRIVKGETKLPAWGNRSFPQEITIDTGYKGFNGSGIRYIDGATADNYGEVGEIYTIYNPDTGIITIHITSMVWSSMANFYTLTWVLY